MAMYKASKEFHKHFPEKKLKNFLDLFLSYIRGCKSGSFLHKKHDVLEKNNCKEAKDFIKKLI